MIEIPLLDELRQIRYRLSQECQGDVERYMQMLKETTHSVPGKYITQPLFPKIDEPSQSLPLEPERESIPIPVKGKPLSKTILDERDQGKGQ